ncbi:MAG: hypothetical protein H6832_07230 [Planctomycetes bacterium]|nr:hypothetical protein [Planctomycetota bacterium]MCB9890362.1 hypothetical protein [Planctomycetota bacterium]MCB9918180.1 hypothetical protein [Planctomycetota bacterium]
MKVDAPVAYLWRHYRENLRKCSLEPLVGDTRFVFSVWRSGISIEATGCIVLEIDAPVLTRSDAGSPFVLLDSTWRYLTKMRASVVGDCIPRSLPASLGTAYPRTAKLSENPARGLASIEALYAALRIVGARDDALLASYHWGAEFLHTCDQEGL